jgi:hypothetical protein
MNVKPCSVLYFISIELKNLNLSPLLSDQPNAGSVMKPLTKCQERKYVLLVRTTAHLRGSKLQNDVSGEPLQTWGITSARATLLCAISSGTESKVPG